MHDAVVATQVFAKAAERPGFDTHARRIARNRVIVVPPLPDLVNRGLPNAPAVGVNNKLVLDHKAARARARDICMRSD